MEKTVDLVIARYNEDIDWLKDYSKYKFNRIFIYNKGKKKDLKDCPLEVETIYKTLPNVGRCDHTYIYHIIHNYDTLASVTIFAKGSVICPYRILGNREPDKFSKTIEKVFATHDTVITGKHYPPDLKASMAGFELSAYRARCEINNNSETSDNLIPANPRPFNEWYKKHFSTIHEDRASFSGIFAVSSSHIKQHRIPYYKTFLNELAVGSNPEVGHYMERAWFAIFYKIPEHCFIEIPMQGGRKTRKVLRKKRKTK
jgi:hypothetical protein